MSHDNIGNKQPGCKPQTQLARRCHEVAVTVELLTVHEVALS